MVIWIRNDSTAKQIEWVDFTGMNPTDAQIGFGIRTTLEAVNTLTRKTGVVHVVVVTE